MQLHSAINNVFVQLNTTLELLTPHQYTKPVNLLSNATIGEHVRHIIELFTCLDKGYETGTVNYDSRARDHQIEANKDFASSLLRKICEELDKPDIPLALEASYEDSSETPITIATNYYREVAYNLEHAVHHMALIRIGVSEVSEIALPEGFGVASSTLKYRKEFAQ
ncbi:MAG TPA: hypothetical protein PLP23_06435 [Panacibacter sp.]|nr:hypothetical protein [Panacibacter sp.]